MYLETQRNCVEHVVDCFKRTQDADDDIHWSTLAPESDSHPTWTVTVDLLADQHRGSAQKSIRSAQLCISNLTPSTD